MYRVAERHCKMDKKVMSATCQGVKGGWVMEGF